MNRFVHCLWGIPPTHPDYKDNHWFSRLSKVGDDIKLYMANPYSPETTVYIFGQENYKRMIDLGFECKLLDKRPYVFDMEKSQYTHKIVCWQEATIDFDSMVFLDWDCVPLKPIHTYFWDRMNEGSEIKAPIYIYHRKRVYRPPNDHRKVCSASFVYIKGHKHADGIMKTWIEMGKPWKEEEPETKYIDSLSGGWKDVENYKQHDTYCYQMSKVPGLEKDSSEFIFGHFNKHIIGGLLGDGKGIKDRLDNLSKVLKI